MFGFRYIVPYHSSSGLVMQKKISKHIAQYRFLEAPIRIIFFLSIDEKERNKALFPVVFQAGKISSLYYPLPAMQDF